MKERERGREREGRGTLAREDEEIDRRNPKRSLPFFPVLLKSE